MHRYRIGLSGRAEPHISRVMHVVEFEDDRHSNVRCTTKFLRLVGKGLEILVKLFDMPIVGKLFVFNFDFFSSFHNRFTNFSVGTAIICARKNVVKNFPWYVSHARFYYT